MSAVPPEFYQLLLYAQPGDVAQIEVDGSRGTITKGGADRWDVEIPDRITRCYSLYANMATDLDAVIRQASQAVLHFKGQSRCIDRGNGPAHVLRHYGSEY